MTPEELVDAHQDALAKLMNGMPEGLSVYVFTFGEDSEGRTSLAAIGNCDAKAIIPALLDWIRRVRDGDDGVEL
jgi:hypothetical protein